MNAMCSLIFLYPIINKKICKSILLESVSESTSKRYCVSENPIYARSVTLDRDHCNEAIGCRQLFLIPSAAVVTSYTNVLKSFRHFDSLNDVDCFQLKQFKISILRLSLSFSFLSFSSFESNSSDMNDFYWEILSFDARYAKKWRQRLWLLYSF